MMRKQLMIMTVMMMVLVMMMVGCGKDNGSTGTDDTADTGIVATVVPTATPTPVPEYAIADVTGTWCVGTILDSEGTPLSETKMQQMGAGFSLELLEDGNYFVYDADGVVMGQGTYAVDKNELILSAAEAETRYVIDDENTLSITSADDSVTMMTRCCSDVETDEEEADTDGADTDEADADAETDDADTSGADENTDDTDADTSS